MELKVIWSAITLIGIILAATYRSSFKQFIGPVLIGFTGAIWVAYIERRNSINGLHARAFNEIVLHVETDLLGVGCSYDPGHRTGL